MNDKPGKTPLYDIHVSNNANMVVFGGYAMPLWYASAKKEHLAVLTGTGLFDTSHMSTLIIEGQDAFDIIQLCFTRDISRCMGGHNRPIYDGRSVYGAFLNIKGWVIDDAIIFRLKEKCYMAVINSGMGSIIAEHLKNNIGSRDVKITDLTDKVGKIDIQGMDSAMILKRILADHETVFNGMKYFSFKGHFDTAYASIENIRLKDGTPLLLSRTGYTGEFGFEIFINPDHLVKLWKLIMSAGQQYGLIPCGLAARDSLRAGAMLPLSHQDIGSWPFINHPWDFALSFNSDRTGFTKKFIGDEALLNIKNPEFIYPFAGFDLRKVSVSDPAVVLDSHGSIIGDVLTCVTDMGIGRQKNRIYSISSPKKPDDFNAKGLCCGFIKVLKPLKYGEIVKLKDKRREIKVEVVSDIRPDRTARVGNAAL
ncbi:MAG: aminomethyltransferase family protein [Deltaproteobacteria bacterium]|nr:aminomethyltransferase family protein [Deltaproteobacteria bacterium]